jgi:hypothetical protein
MTSGCYLPVIGAPVGFFPAPGQLGAARSAIGGPDPVGPVVVADEVPARPAQHPEPQLAEQAEHVLAEAACHSAHSTPIAITSLCTKIAVSLGERPSSSRVATAPPCGVQSPSATISSLGSSPASRSASS